MIFYSRYIFCPEPSISILSPIPGRCSFQTVSNLKSLKLKVPASEIWIGGTGRGLWRAGSRQLLASHWSPGQDAGLWLAQTALNVRSRWSGDQETGAGGRQGLKESQRGHLSLQGNSNSSFTAVKLGPPALRIEFCCSFQVTEAE